MDYLWDWWGLPDDLKGNILLNQAGFRYFILLRWLPSSYSVSLSVIFVFYQLILCFITGRWFKWSLSLVYSQSFVIRSFFFCECLLSHSSFCIKSLIFVIPTAFTQKSTFLSVVSLFLIEKVPWLQLVCIAPRGLDNFVSGLCPVWGSILWRDL